MWCCLSWLLRRLLRSLLRWRLLCLLLGGGLSLLSDLRGGLLRPRGYDLWCRLSWLLGRLLRSLLRRRLLRLQLLGGSLSLLSNLCCGLLRPRGYNLLS